MMRDVDYYTDETCERCGGDGCDPELSRHDPVTHAPWPDACCHCEGHGKKIDPVKHAVYMDEYYYRTFKL